MIKDITIGQYFPGNSVIHRMDARIKIIMTAVFIVMLFAANSVWGLLVGIAFTILTFIISKIPGKLMLKSLKPIVPIIIFTAILNLLFIRTGKAYFEWKFLKITDEGVDTAVFMMIRIKVPVHELAMMMTIALRFIPTLIEETDKIMSAQKARGADMETGSLIQKAKALIPVLIPLFVASFRHAEELALAMECRCYHGGEGRTRMKQLHMSIVDLYGSIFCVLFLAGVIVINIVI